MKISFHACQLDLKYSLLRIASFTLLFTFQTPPIQAEEVQLKALMHYFNGSLSELKPYMTSFEAFQDPKNKQIIAKELKDLEKKISQTQPQQISDSAGFNLSYNLMARHLRDTIKLFESKIYVQAWEKMNATTSFCISCHTRLPEKVDLQTSQLIKEKAEVFEKNSIQDAEFYFLSHQYSRALDIYNEKIKNFDQSKSNSEDLKKIYERKITFYARVIRDPKAAIASLQQDGKNKNLPTEYFNHLKTWIKGFKAIEKEQKKNLTNLTDSLLVDYAKKILEKNTSASKINITDPQTLPLLHISGLLYERLFKNQNSEQVPEMLFLLAKTEKQLASIRVYSLSDIYLSECVNKYSKSPVAKKCFQDYEVSMRSKYGATVPDYINSSIEALRKKIN
jgi:hypothetical protein